MNSNLKLALAVFIGLLFLGLLACGHGKRAVMTPQLGSPAVEQSTPSATDSPAVEWPQALPADGVQPWEEVDANGFVISPSEGKGASGINLNSQFVPGADRFLEAGSVVDLGEASRFDSGVAGNEDLSYAIYRIPMAGEQPGAIAVDANVHINGAYYAGVADYGADTWHWYGPFSQSHVRFTLPHYDYLSGVGNLMLAVVAYNGASFDLVGLSANARDDADTIAPDPPENLALTPIPGGVLAEWFPVAAGDLAGYRVYVNGQEALGYVEGGTSVVLGAEGDVEVTVTSVDVSGNEGGLSAPEAVAAGPGFLLNVIVSPDAASGRRGEVITLNATGGDTYDWDVNGDGTWDITGDATGTAVVDTSNLGIIRPALRGHDASGGFSLNAVSLIISGNSRPVALATADVASGPAPLSVNFTITGEDDDGTIAEYAWDFEGDGMFDDVSPTDPSPVPHSYAADGIYNAKFRVTDNEGAWDVDTVAILVMADPPNQPPVAMLNFNTNRVYMGEAGDNELISFNATGSYDPEGGPLEFAWDADGNGFFAAFGPGGTLDRAYTTPGSYLASVRARDDNGLVAEATRQVYAYRFRHYMPDPTNDTTYCTSLAVVGGLPAFSHYNWGSGDLKYSRATTASPLSSTDWNSYAIDTTDDVGYWNSLVVMSNGNPAIAYVDNTNGNLEFAYATVPLPDNAAYWFTYTIDSSGTVGRWLSMAVRDGYPIISYYDITNGDLKFARSTLELPTAPGDWAIHTVDSADDVGRFCNLSVVSTDTADFPAIAYWDQTNDDVKYARASLWPPASSGGWLIYTLDGDDGSECGYMGVGSLREPGAVNGNPVVTYMDRTNWDLKIAIASVLEPSSAADWSIYALDDGTTYIGTSSSVARIGGRLFVSYWEMETLDLKLAKAKIGNPTSATDWWFHQVDTGYVFTDWFTTSLAVMDGKPIITYGNTSPNPGGFAIPTLD